MLRIALPSDGELYEPTLQFLRLCGMPVQRISLRRYTATIPSLPYATVLFQRSADITSKVDEGSADMGVVGLDRFLEGRLEEGNTLLVMDDLGFGECDLVIGVPDTWVDVTSMADLADLSVEFRDQGRELRVATKFPRQVQHFLLEKGVNYYTLVQASGTLEAAPAMGFADIIGDISASGATLRENRLKTLEDGTILTSQACLIANPSMLAREQNKLQEARSLLERVEGYLRSQDFYTLTANIQGNSAEEVSAYLVARRQVAGLRGPTVAKVYASDMDDWYAATIVVPKKLLMDAVTHLREVGAKDITIFQPNYVLHDECKGYSKLLKAIDKESLAQL